MEDRLEQDNGHRWLWAIFVIALLLGLFYLAYDYLYAKVTTRQTQSTLTVERAGGQRPSVAEAAELEGGVVVKINEEDTAITIESFGITFDYPASWTINTENGAKIDWRLSGTAADETADVEMRLVQTNGSTHIFPKYLVGESGFTKQTVTLLASPYSGYKNAYTYQSGGSTQKWLKYAFKLYRPTSMGPWVIFAFRSDRAGSAAIEQSLLSDLTIEKGE